MHVPIPIITASSQEQALRNIDVSKAKLQQLASEADQAVIQ